VVGTNSSAQATAIQPKLCSSFFKFNPKPIQEAIMSQELTKNQQLSQELSDQDLEAVAGGSANAVAVSNAKAEYGSIAISDSKAQAVDVELNKFANQSYYSKSW
jgi:hypothetical protein